MMAKSRIECLVHRGVVARSLDVVNVWIKSGETATSLLLPWKRYSLSLLPCTLRRRKKGICVCLIRYFLQPNFHKPSITICFTQQRTRLICFPCFAPHFNYIHVKTRPINNEENDWNLPARTEWILLHVINI